MFMMKEMLNSRNIGSLVFHHSYVTHCTYIYAIDWPWCMLFDWSCSLEIIAKQNGLSKY